MATPGWPFDGGTTAKIGAGLAAEAEKRGLIMARLDAQLAQLGGDDEAGLVVLDKMEVPGAPPQLLERVAQLVRADVTAKQRQLKSVLTRYRDTMKEELALIKDYEAAREAMRGTSIKLSKGLSECVAAGARLGESWIESDFEHRDAKTLIHFRGTIRVPYLCKWDGGFGGRDRPQYRGVLVSPDGEELKGAFMPMHFYTPRDGRWEFKQICTFETDAHVRMLVSKLQYGAALGLLHQLMASVPESNPVHVPHVMPSGFHSLAVCAGVGCKTVYSVFDRPHCPTCGGMYKMALYPMFPVVNDVLPPGETRETLKQKWEAAEVERAAKRKVGFVWVTVVNVDEFGLTDDMYRRYIGRVNDATCGWCGEGRAEVIATVPTSGNYVCDTCSGYLYICEEPVGIDKCCGEWAFKGGGGYKCAEHGGPTVPLDTDPIWERR